MAEWVDPPEFAPVYPTDEPKFLSVAAADEAWRTVKQVPSLTSGEVGDTLMYQTGDTFAWESVRWFTQPPDNKKYLFCSTGTGTDGATSSTTTVELDAGKCTTLWEDDTDKNYGAAWDFYLRASASGTQRIALFEFDCSAYSSSSYNYDNLESVKIKFYPTNVWGSTNQTVHIRRIKNTFVQGTGESSNSYNDDGATWAKPTAPGGSPDWSWGGGNFNADKELDYELPACTFQMGTGTGTETTAGAYSSIDITPLFLDAIRNRSGILRFCIYVPLSTITSTTTIRCYSNDNHTNETELEIKYANARKAYWQPWNYNNSSTVAYQGSDSVTYQDYYNRDNQGHINSYIANSFSYDELTGGHSTTGTVVAFHYAISQESSANYFARSLNAYTVPDGLGNITVFTDMSVHNAPNQTVGSTARISTIWTENE